MLVSVALPATLYSARMIRRVHFADGARGRNAGSPGLGKLHGERRGLAGQAGSAVAAADQEEEQGSGRRGFLQEVAHFSYSQKLQPSAGTSLEPASVPVTLSTVCPDFRIAAVR